MNALMSAMRQDAAGSLTQAQELQYQTWLAQQSKARGLDLGSAYGDLRGVWKSGGDLPSYFASLGPASAASSSPVPLATPQLTVPNFNANNLRPSVMIDDRRGWDHTPFDQKLTGWIRDRLQ
jgi:hypothetical protein